MIIPKEIKILNRTYVFKKEITENKSNHGMISYKDCEITLYEYSGRYLPESVETEIFLNEIIRSISKMQWLEMDNAFVNRLVHPLLAVIRDNDLDFRDKSQYRLAEKALEIACEEIDCKLPLKNRCPEGKKGMSFPECTKCRKAYALEQAKKEMEEHDEA